ncbi:Oidioi.mRNA.OKI2018_I69.XSR.g13771.t1.cds [Oikopleura dioica]|uniref:Oidioi.mRNA.OKI2018_I69.XSR.g13771.t1.cds n=1 Tax=Oikopleura dioica TaxID=34765 RepID=A0ABN7SGE7_OIKDI|nr:Oidioi.mRNA.OKI2018_I69.XSR.g13771.t1.cds [Oikopleura dioica]
MRGQIGLLIFFIALFISAESLSVQEKRARVLECLLEFATDKRKESCANLGTAGESSGEILELQLSTLDNGGEDGKVVKIEALLPKIENSEGSGDDSKPNLAKIKKDLDQAKYQLELLEKDLEDMISPK